MFDSVYKLAQHQQRLTILTKQHKRLQAQGVYGVYRMHHLEVALLNHLYTVCDVPTHTPHVLAGMSLSQLADAGWKACFTLLTGHPDEAAIYHLIACYDLITEEIADSHVFEAHSAIESQAHMALLNCRPVHWQSRFDDALLARLFTLPEHYNRAFKQRVLSQPLTDSQAMSCLQSGCFDMQFSALLNGYCQSAAWFAEQLFAVFSRSNDEQIKARLLCLAGLTGDERWHEPCELFCAQHPQYSVEVLSHFQHKTALLMIIKLMGKAHVATQAYQAWQCLTNKPLPQVPLLAAVEPHNINALQTSQLQQAKMRPNLDAAEHERQRLALIKGGCVLNGVSYSPDNALTALADLAGIYVQRAALKQFSLPAAAMLYYDPLSAWQWRQISSDNTAGMAQ
ncbi:hypothetical protein PCIT_a2535 [Pseudoalteromonas citrea]|uniref:Uncharacterized protein n=2 Tax=Pseudoalteromonas citrea TaxID=43655 RepID=A0AAD4AHE9_9GAMM|nr:hypothetical protein PCIT_a2535 [Pseudoalteromonas citrea]